MKKRSLFFLIVLFIIGSAAYGQTGPGGVSTSGSLQFWYKADAITATDGSALSAWQDQSANSLNTLQRTGALSFDGIDDKCAPSSSYLYSQTNTFTVEMWVNPEAEHQQDEELNSGTLGMEGQRYVIFPEQGKIWNEDNSHAGMGISVGTNGVSVYEHADTYMPAVIVYNGSITGWTHIAVVYQNGQPPKLYKNGVLVKTGQSGGKTVHPSINSVGGGPYGNFKGGLDELRVWSTARTASEISTNMTLQFTGPATGLIGNWRMDEGSGSILDDASGSSADLNFAGGAANPGRITQNSSIITTASKPTYTASSINSKPAVCFNGTSGLLEVPSGAYNNAGPYTFRAINMVVKTGTNVTNRQVIYEEGGSDKGINLYIFNGKFYAAAWNTTTDVPDPSAELPWSIKYVSETVEINTSYIVSFIYDFANDKVEAFLNGTSLGVSTNVGKLFAHSSGTIGYSAAGTRFHDMPTESSGYYFGGCISDVTSYNSLNSAQRKLVENFYSWKYNITIANDYYSYNGSHNYQIAGLGGDNASNQYLTATSDFLTISQTTMADGAFAFVGHDNQATTYLPLTGNTPPNVQRIQRSWRLDLTGQVTTLNFKVLQSSLGSLPAPLYQRYVLLLDSDGDFLTGSRVIALDASGSDLVVSGATVQDGDYISFGVLHQYQYASTYTGNTDAFGKANLNYLDVYANSGGFALTDPSGLDAGDYLLLSHNNGTITLANTSTPVAHVVRSSRVWRLNKYGDVGQISLQIDPSTFALPSGKDNYVMLIDRDQDGNFTNAEMVGMVKEGAVYKSYYVSVNNGDLITVAAGVAATNLKVLKDLSKTFVEATSQELTNHATKKLVVKAQNDYDYLTPCVRSTKKMTVNLLFNTGDDYIFGNNAFTTQVQVQVKGYTNYTSTGSPTTTYNATLNLSQSEPEVLHIIDVTDEFLNQGIKSYDVTVTGYTASSISLLNSSLTLKAYIEEDEAVSVPITTGSEITVTNYTTTGKSYTFSWDTDKCGAPVYQFQLMRLYNTQDPANTDEHVIKANPDWNQALTLETTNKSLTLTMTEGTGYYAWRVRPLGNYYEGGSANSQNWGTWSTANTTTITSPLNLTCTSANLATCLAPYNNSIFYFDQFDGTKNFIYSRTFTEDNKIHEGISYANGLLQTKQTQTKVPSNSANTAGNPDGKVIAGQSIYDYSGRPAVTTLPAPVLDNTKNEIGYITGLVKTSAGLYGPQNFDTDSKIQAPDAVDPVNGGFINSYYSDSNTDEPNVPSAQNYPFSRTIYDTEGNGRVIEESGAGVDHKIGSGHTVRVQYGSVSDDELIRVFGDEAPAATSVYKVSTTDQNNITSVSYIDKEGKTIATCLVKNNLSTNLTPLPTESASEYSIKEVVDKNVPYSTNGLLATKALSFSEPTDVKISYELTPKIITSYCGDYCTTCGYLLKIKILDLNTPANNKIIQKTIAPGTVKDISADGNCTATLTPVDLDAVASGNDLSITLPAGKYIVEKIIQLDESAAQTYASNVVNRIDQTLQGYVTNINNYLDAGDINGLNTYLKGLQAETGDVKTEVYSDAGIALFSMLDNRSDNNTVLTTIPDGSIVKLVTTCCKVEVPVMYPEFDPCLEANKPTLGNYFAQYLQDKASTSITTASGGLYTSASDFNIMIQNMLTDLYDCQKLWDAWKAAVLSAGQFGSIDVGDGIKKQDDYNDYPDWVKDKSNTPMSGPNDIIRQFLETAKYHYAGYTTNASLLKYKPYKYFSYDRSSMNDVKRMCENAFCNYVSDYTAPVSGTLTYQPCTNGDMCTKTQNLVTTDPLGNYYTLTVGLNNLNETDYYALNQCLKNNINSGGAAYDEAKLETDVALQKEKMETECRNECDAKYPMFLESLKKMNVSDYWGPEIQVNGDCNQGQGGWVDGNNNTPVWVYAPDYFNLHFIGTVKSTTILTVNKTYRLRFRLGTFGASTCTVKNGTTVLYFQDNNTEPKVTTLEFVATSTQLTFESTSMSMAAVTLDDVSIKELLPKLLYPAEDLCCTARQLVDYCKQSCNLTIRKSDCAPTGAGPEDKLLGLGTAEEIDRWQAIMLGTYELQIPPSGGSCASGYEPDKLYLGSFYPFNGNLNDESGNGLTATSNGATLTTNMEGVVDKAYSFNGTSGYITCQSNDRSVTDKATVMAWINTTATTGTIISKYSSTTQGYELNLNGGHAEFIGRDAAGNRSSGTNSLALGLPAINDGNWHHVVGVANKGAWEVWVDGIKRSEYYLAATLNLANTEVLTIGKRSSANSQYFNGKIDDVMIYNTASTKGEIEKLCKFSNFIGYTTATANCTNPPLTKIADFTYGGIGNESPSFFERTPDGGYIIAGVSQGSTDLSSKTGANIYVSKISPGGRIIWRKILGGNGDDILVSFRQTAKNEILLAGTSTSSTINGYTSGGPQVYTLQGSQDFYFIKLDQAGNILVEKLLGYNGEETLGDLLEVPGGYLLCGGTTSNNIPSNSIVDDKDGYLLKISAEGNPLVHFTSKSSKRDFYVDAVISANNEIFALSYEPESESSDLYEGKLSSLSQSFVLNWTKKNHSTRSISRSFVEKTFDGGALVAYITSSPLSVLINGEFNKMSPSGDIMWTKEVKNVRYLKEMINGDIVIAGTDIAAPGVTGLYIYKLRGSDGTTKMGLSILLENFFPR